jgi:hypothetical protein
MIPAFIDPEAWAGFCDMRKACKKPLTPRAAKMILVELVKIKEAGHDPNAALDQSTNHCWADVYVPKQKDIQQVSTKADEKLRAEFDAMDANATKPPPELMARLKSTLKRVA